MTAHHSVGRQTFSVWLAGGVALALGCSGPQSTLDPAGRQAEQLASLFWWMTAGVAIIWVAVMGIALYAAYTTERSDLTGPRRLIVWGGVIVPTVLLTALLSYGLALLPEFLAPAPAGSLRIAVTGEQYWWRVRYLPHEGAPVDLANEIRLPVGRKRRIPARQPRRHPLVLDPLARRQDGHDPGRARRA